MTKLSLFLWAADALDSMSNIFTYFGVVIAIVIFMYCCYIVFAWLDDDEALFSKRNICVFVAGLLICVGSFVMSAAIPEKKTMYMIAGVELVNEFRQTDLAHELTDEMKNMVHDITGIIHNYAVESVQKTETK